MPILGNSAWNSIERHFQVLEVPRRDNKYTRRKIIARAISPHKKSFLRPQSTRTTLKLTWFLHYYQHHQIRYFQWRRVYTCRTWKCPKKRCQQALVFLFSSTFFSAPGNIVESPAGLRFLGGTYICLPSGGLPEFENAPQWHSNLNYPDSAFSTSYSIYVPHLKISKNAVSASISFSFF